MAPAPQHDRVAEFQGLYGPFVCPERVLQKIWLRGEFDRAKAGTIDGHPLDVVSPGTWNLLGGPDFRGAEIRIGGERVVGDVEVHFRVGDWRHHGHEANPAYAQVVLHVVLFPPAWGEPPARRLDGVALPALVLLPLLWRDLEEHASDDALESLTARDDWRRIEELAGRPIAELRRMLGELARRRWEQKVGFARLRLAKLGWAGAAHHAALEILGYRRNRAPMLAVAARHPLAEWAAGLEVGAVWHTPGLAWNTHGVRPANHPRTRLAQYAAWARARPDWMERLRGWGESVPELVAGSMVSPPSRGEWGLRRLRRQLAEDVTAGACGGSRLENLATDGFLPLLAATGGRDLFGAWFHWYAGDAPYEVVRALSRLGVAGAPGWPFSHGWVQGMLGWLLSPESHASA